MVKNFESFENTENQVLEDGSSITDKFRTSELAYFVSNKFSSWQKDRYETEKRFVKSYYNFRGFYGREVAFTDSEKSRVFIKITKTKVMAAYGQILDVLFGNGDFPLSIEPKRLPDIRSDVSHIDIKEVIDQSTEEQSLTELSYDAIGFAGDGRDLQAGDTIMSRLGSYLKEKFSGMKVQEGPAKEATDIQIEPAKLIAKRVEKKIKDQLDATAIVKNTRRSLLECVILGTGILKGPFVDEKEVPNWSEDGVYEPIFIRIPVLRQVSPFNIYVDRYATSTEDCEGLIERHILTDSQMTALKVKPLYRAEAIEAAMKRGFNYVAQWWEQDLKENDIGAVVNRYEAYEYWGVVNRSMLEEFDLDIPDALGDSELINVNIWECNGEIIRLVLNPFKPARIPYFVFPYEEDPYNFYGVGLPENMEDAQTLMNGFARMSVDNAVLSGSVLLEVDEDNLVAGQDMSISPGKIFRRNGGQVGQTIYPIKIPNISQENLAMFDRFRQLADEETGIPSYSHGASGSAGMTRTASGMSMLFGAASLNIKTIVKNIDDYLIQPLGEAMYSFNNQFDFDKELIADLEIRAAGTKSLMQKEVRSQKILQFLQVASNPMLAPFVNYESLIKDFACSLDLDPDKITLDPKMRQAQVMMLQQSGALGQNQQQPAPSGAPDVNDQTGGGGGNIGTGDPAMPNTEQFSASPQQTGANPNAGF